MTARETRLGLLAFLVLAAGLAANMLMFQAPQHVRSRARAGVEADAAAAERMRRLSLGAGASSAGSTTPIAMPTGAVGSAADPKVVNSGALPAGPETASSAAAAAGVPNGESVETIRAIQRELQLKGYHPGGADGVPGLMTRAAIMAFEHDQGQPLTGEASDRLLKAILFGAVTPRAAGVALSPPSPGAEAVIRTVQQTLSSLGYAIGAVDGRVGPDTERAVRAFETQAGLPETGRVSGVLLARLGKASAARGRSATR